MRVSRLRVFGIDGVHIIDGSTVHITPIDKSFHVRHYARLVHMRSNFLNAFITDSTSLINTEQMGRTWPRRNRRSRLFRNR